MSEDYIPKKQTFDDEGEESSSRSNSADLVEPGTDKEISSDKIIRSFLSKINKYPKNKANILKHFEESFFNLKIAIEIDSVKRLFFGDSRDGLLKMASEMTDSFLANSQIIGLIAKLLDTKRNVYADSFNKIFATWKPEMIKSMKLDLHIINQKTWENNDACFIVFNYISQKNMQGISIEAEQVLSTEEGIEIYLDWNEKLLAKPSEFDLIKGSKSVIIQVSDQKSDFDNKSERIFKFNESSTKNRSVGVSPPPKYLASIQK